ncbi:hypothetical protein EVAR_84250_1 [Eumeta japonica]|uniref:Reverse transcriptase domain-containing protein n=1 Tax=Eumeta variegata TaxID=151549 RepID=A0A4C1WUF5_EUMVA|nr:hypothetical protein EVAR_84250_1 [Eumeta japonica]
MQLAYFAISKAFDCVYHETLIGKLRHYGVTGRALDLLKSYWSNRVQRVDVNVRNKELEFVNSTVFLGITLDDRLQWGPHIKKKEHMRMFTCGTSGTSRKLNCERMSRMRHLNILVFNMAGSNQSELEAEAEVKLENNNTAGVHIAKVDAVIVLVFVSTVFSLAVVHFGAGEKRALAICKR